MVCRLDTRDSMRKLGMKLLVMMYDALELRYWALG
jgi:hypothetical protein